MEKIFFTATSPYEIGDSVLLPLDVKPCTITDIACIHYAKSRIAEFLYELDGKGWHRIQKGLRHEN